MSRKYQPGQYADQKGTLTETHQPNVVATAEGTAKPADATAGYAAGSLFLVRGDGLYINTGSVTSCLFVKLPTTFANLVQGLNGGVLTAGLKIVGGQTTTVTASDTVVTGLTTVISAVANLDSAPTTDPEIATASIGDQAGSPAAGSILIQTWKTFGGTPAAATTFSKKVNWLAIGT